MANRSRRGKPTHPSLYQRSPVPQSTWTVASSSLCPTRKTCRAARLAWRGNGFPRDTEIAGSPKRSADANAIDAGPGGAFQDGIGGDSFPCALLLPVAIDDDAHLAPSGGRNGLTRLPDRSGGRPSVALTAPHAVPDHAVWPQFRASPMAGMSSQRSSHQRSLSRHRTRTDRRESSCQAAASPTDSSRKSKLREKMHSPQFLGQTRSPSSEGDVRLACFPLAPSVEWRQGGRSRAIRRRGRPP